MKESYNISITTDPAAYIDTNQHGTMYEKKLAEALRDINHNQANDIITQPNITYHKQ